MSNVGNAADIKAQFKKVQKYGELATDGTVDRVKKVADQVTGWAINKQIKEAESNPNAKFRPRIEISDIEREFGGSGYVDPEKLKVGVELFLKDLEEKGYTVHNYAGYFELT